MPKRQNDQKAEPIEGEFIEGATRYDHLIDLHFLPRQYVERIDEIFDSYFNLGLQQNYQNMEKKGAPQFPMKVSSLSSPELGDRHGEFAAWYSFAADKFKYVICAHNYMETEMNKQLDMVLGEQRDDKGNIEAKKARARNSEGYILLLSYMQKLSGLKTMLDYELKSYEKSVAALSREISRREINAGF